MKEQYKEQVKIDFASSKTMEEATIPRRGSLTLIFEYVMQKFNEAFIENLPSDDLKELPPKCEILCIDT
jgi:hypothetical protein